MSGRLVTLGDMDTATAEQLEVAEAPGGEARAAKDDNQDGDAEDKLPAETLKVVAHAFSIGVARGRRRARAFDPGGD